MSKHLAIFDTTLRDGLQTPGLPAISRTERLRIAQMLESMGVDVIEAGFPSSSPESFASVKAIAEAVTESTVCALAMATKESIDRAAQALAPAKRSRIHIFLGSSEKHLKKLGLSCGQMTGRVDWAVRYAAKLGVFDEIEFSPEDAIRTDFGFLARVVQVAVQAGAAVINIPDTVGYSMPEEYGRYIRHLRDHTRKYATGGKKVVWSVHCHDDFGCATANTLSGVKAGARQVEGTLYQLGERAGNAAWEEVVMAVRKRQDYFDCDSRIDASQFWKAARTVEEITKVAIPPNKAVIGKNAFSHESGIHQDGVLKDPGTYEVMDPREVGWQGRSLPLGAQSGRSGVRQRLHALEIRLSDKEFEDVFARFKNYADIQGSVDDESLRGIVTTVLDLTAV